MGTLAVETKPLHGTVVLFKEKEEVPLKSSNNDVLCPGGSAAYIRLTYRSMVVRVSHVVV